MDGSYDRVTLYAYNIIIPENKLREKYEWIRRKFAKRFPRETATILRSRTLRWEFQSSSIETAVSLSRELSEWPVFQSTKTRHIIPCVDVWPETMQTE